MARGLKEIVRSGTTMPRDVIVLTLNAFFVALGFGVMMPVLPVYARSFGVDNFQISWVVSAFALMRLVTAPFCGKVNGLIGEKGALVVGTAIVSVSSLAAGLSQSFWQLLVFRALGGIGSAMFTVAAMTLLLASVAPQMRGRASGFYQGGFVIGGMAGPALGGIVASASIQAPFFFYAATLAMGCLACLLLLHRRTGVHTSGGGDGFPMRVALRDVRYQAALATAFAQGWQSFGVRSSLVPILVVDVMHKGPSWTGYAMAAAAVVQGLTLAPAGRATDTIGRRPVMIAAGVVTGLSALLMPLSGSYWLLVVWLAVYAVGSSMHATAPTAAVGDATQGQGGTPIAVFSMMADVGSIIGPLVAGLMADSVGLVWPFVLGAALLLGASAWSLLMPREEFGRGKPDPAEVAL